MADQNPPRAAVVVKTIDGQRIKPACPICHAVSWGVPHVPLGANETGDASVQPVVSVLRQGNMISLPVRLHICQNCGYIWQMASMRDAQFGVDKE